MVGYAKDHSGDTYCMYNPSTKRIIQSQDIRWADWISLIPSQDSPIDITGIDEEFDSFGPDVLNKEVVKLESFTDEQAQ